MTTVLLAVVVGILFGATASADLGLMVFRYREPILLKIAADVWEDPAEHRRDHRKGAGGLSVGETQTPRRLAISSVCWRVCASGTQRAFLNCWNKDGTASISTPGIKGKWSLKPTNVQAADLFALRSDARAEYHKRRFGISGAPGEGGLPQ
jgi:hypothetical protein